MRKILLIYILSLLTIHSKSQILATSDTINDIKFIFYSIYSDEWYKRDSYRYSPSLEDKQQNFRDLMLKKERVEDENYYVMTFKIVTVLEYNSEAYFSNLIRSAGKSTERFYSSEHESYFAMTEKQYIDLKKCLQKNDGKIHKFNSKINGNTFVEGLSIKSNLKNKYRVKKTFAIRSDGSKVYFRLPEEYYALRLSNKLFNRYHFECDIKTFNKIIID